MPRFASRAPLLTLFILTTLLACVSAAAAPPSAPTATRDAGIPAPSRSADAGPTPIDNAVSVIDALRPFFRACYNRGLATDRAMAGSVTVQVRIAPNGAVDSPDAVVKDGLSPAVIECLSWFLRRATFDAPGGSGSTLNVPLKFVRQAPPPPSLVPPGAPPIAPMVDGIAGFRFGMTVAEVTEHCRAVGRPSALVGNDPRIRSHACDAVEVEPGMRLNMNLGFCQRGSRLCEISYWTNRNAAAAYRLLEGKLVARYGNAPVQSGNLRDETLEQQCRESDGKVRRTWWWGPESARTNRVLLVFTCEGSDQTVGVYYDDPLGTAEQVARQKEEASSPGR
jgi:hypothetical protein